MGFFCGFRNLPTGVTNCRSVSTEAANTAGNSPRFSVPDHKNQNLPVVLSVTQEQSTLLRKSKYALFFMVDFKSVNKLFLDADIPMR